MLTYQSLFSLAASVAGFVSALSFCVGNIFNTVENITLQSTPFWDFNKHLAKALVTQKAQYLTGGLFLFLSFILQLCSAIPSTISSMPLEPPYQSWLMITMFMTAIFAGLAYFMNKKLESYLIERVTSLNAIFQTEGNEMEQK